jgi:hypothetical protein
MSIEKQNPTETSQFKDISHEALLKIELPENFVYEGKGVTSWKDTYDDDKLNYIKSAGIEFPEDWEKDRPMLITSFIVLQRFAAFKDCQRDGGNTERFFKIMLKDLEEHRLDTIGYRENLSEPTNTEPEKNYTDYIKEVGGSSNVSQKVSPVELREICGFLVQELTE